MGVDLKASGVCRNSDGQAVSFRNLIALGVSRTIQFPYGTARDLTVALLAVHTNAAHPADLTTLAVANGNVKRSITVVSY